MELIKKLLLAAILLGGTSLFAHAQSTITFNINLEPMLKDSTFIPGQDVVQIVGNMYPLGPNRAIQMFDKEPIDSVYTAEIRFSRRYNDQELEYNFVIAKPEKDLTESLPRKFRLRGRDSELPALYFDAFAW